METVKTEMKTKIQAMLHEIVECLVKNKTAVEVTATQAQKTMIFEIVVAEPDRGKVIGKKGEMAKSLRHIVTSISAANGFRSILEICDVPQI